MFCAGAEGGSWLLALGLLDSLGCWLPSRQEQRSWHPQCAGNSANSDQRPRTDSQKPTVNVTGEQNSASVASEKRCFWRENLAPDWSEPICGAGSCSYCRGNGLASQRKSRR